MPDFQLDKKEILKEVPALLRGIAGQVIDKINNLDANHDGKKDVAQIAEVVMKVLPLLIAIQEMVDFEALAEQLAESPAIKDKGAFKTALKQLGKQVEALGKA